MVGVETRHGLTQSEEFRLRLGDWPRILELERSASDLQGLIDENLGANGGSQQSKAELESQIAQLTNERRAKLSAMLIDTQSNLADLVP